MFYKEYNFINKIFVPILSILFGFIFGAIIMMIFGYNPINGYFIMFCTAFKNLNNICEIFVLSAPLLLIALAFYISKITGFFNIGLSGQVLCGWISSVWFSLTFSNLDKIFLLPLAILVGISFGIISAIIPGILRVYFFASEVIVTIMLNYIYLYISNYLVNDIMSKNIISNKGITNKIPINASLRINFLNFLKSSRFNFGIILSIILIFIIWFIINKTVLGFEMKSVGLNIYTSKCSGININKVSILSFIISGALAGLAGVIQGLGTFEHFFSQSSILNIGFDGMSVALLSNNSFIGMFLSSILFSILKLGGKSMALFSGVPTELVDIVISLIVFFYRY